MVFESIVFESLDTVTAGSRPGAGAAFVPMVARRQRSSVCAAANGDKCCLMGGDMSRICRSCSYYLIGFRTADNSSVRGPDSDG